MSKLNVMLHHERFKIIKELIHGHQLSAKQIAQQIPEISLTTLYRHLGLLERCNIIDAWKKGNTNRNYYMITRNHLKSPGEGNADGEYEMMFFLFMVGAMKDFEKYLETVDADMEKFGFLFKQAVLILSEAECATFVQDYIALIEKYTTTTKKLGADGSTRRLTTMMFPLDIEE